MNSPVFYFKKDLEHNTVLECSVFLMPQHESSTIAYSVILSVKGVLSDAVSVENFTSDRLTAERIFNRICSDNILPKDVGKVLPSKPAI